MFSFILLASLLFVFAVSAQEDDAQLVSCASFWPGVIPGESGTSDAQCVVYPTSQWFADTEVTIAYDEAWKNTPNIAPILDQRVALIQQAAATTVPVYQSLQANVPDLVFILGVDNTDAIAATLIPVENGPCQIFLHFDWFGKLSNDQQRMQTIAHEIYHCVQDAMREPDADSETWWVDGTAEYFSSVVYSQANDEWSNVAQYSPEIPLYANDRYSTCIFFQSLEQSKGPVGIHQWMLSQDLVNDPIAERGRLSRFPGMVDDFNLFARLFSLGQIPDRGGGLVPIEDPVNPDPASLSSGGSESVGTIAISGEPFTIQVFAVQIDPGQTVSLSYASEQQNVRVAYKQANDAVWSNMPNAPVSSAEGTLVLGCNNGNPITVLLLFTSTDDTNMASAVVSVMQLYEDENCQCKDQPGGFKRRRLGKRGLKRCDDLPDIPTNGTCGPVSGQPITDPCLENTVWTLDLASSEELVRSRLSGTPNVVVSSVAISGAGTLTISPGDSSLNASFLYDNFAVQVDISALGMTLPSTTTINGGFEANLYLTAPGEFCLAAYAGSGRATASAPLVGELNFDLGPEGGFVKQEWRISYQCSNGRLDMAGGSNGVTEFGPFVWLR